MNTLISILTRPLWNFSEFLIWGGVTDSGDYYLLGEIEYDESSLLSYDGEGEMMDALRVKKYF